jgi:hypothetical protein
MVLDSVVVWGACGGMRPIFPGRLTESPCSANHMLPYGPMTMLPLGQLSSLASGNSVTVSGVNWTEYGGTSSICTGATRVRHRFHDTMVGRSLAQCLLDSNHVEGLVQMRVSVATRCFHTIGFKKSMYSAAQSTSAVTGAPLPNLQTRALEPAT